MSTHSVSPVDWRANNPPNRKQQDKIRRLHNKKDFDGKIKVQVNQNINGNLSGLSYWTYNIAVWLPQKYITIIEK